MNHKSFEHYQLLMITLAASFSSIWSKQAQTAAPVNTKHFRGQRSDLNNHIFPISWTRYRQSHCSVTWAPGSGITCIHIKSLCSMTLRPCQHPAEGRSEVIMLLLSQHRCKRVASCLQLIKNRTLFWLSSHLNYSSITPGSVVPPSIHPAWV